MIKNMLVPYDFTDFADLAFEKAVEIAKKFEAKITLLTVIGNDTDTTGMSYSRAKEASEEIEEKTKADLDKIKTSKQTEGINLTVDIVHHDSNVDGILSYAKKNDTDLIVMGSHGRSGLKKMVLGSVASGVTTKAKCPVMIVKPSKS